MKLNQLSVRMGIMLSTKHNYDRCWLRLHIQSAESIDRIIFDYVRHGKGRDFFTRSPYLSPPTQPSDRVPNYCEFISSCHLVGISHGSWMIAAWHAIFATNDAHFDLFSLHFIFYRDEMTIFCSDRYN